MIATITQIVASVGIVVLGWVTIQTFANLIRFWRLLRRVERELPCIPTSTADAFRLVSARLLTPEQAALWLEFRESQGRRL